MKKTRKIRELSAGDLARVTGGSGIALGAAAVAAAGTAYAANQSRKAAADANKASNRTTSTNQTTTQTGWGPTQPLLEGALGDAANLYHDGPVLRQGGSQAVDPITGRPIAGGAPKGGGGQSLSGITSRNGVPGIVGKNGVFQPLGASAAAKYAASQGGGSSVAPSLSNMTPKQQVTDIAHRIEQQGIAGDPNGAAADRFVQNTLKPGGLGGNEVWQDLNGRLSGSNLDGGQNLLLQFLGGGYDPNGGGAGDGGGAGSGPYGPALTGAAYSNAAAQDRAMVANGGVSTIGDSTQTPGTFNDFAKGVLSGKYLDPNDPSLKAYLDVLRHQGQDQLDQQMRAVNDEFEGANMYGGSGLALERALTNSRGLQGIQDAQSTALFNSRGQGLQLMDSVSGQVNQRDISGAQINEQANESAAGRAASAASSADALQLARRGQNLDAINSYLQNNQFGVAQLAGLGNSLQGARNDATSMVPALNNNRYTGLNQAMGAAGTLQSMAQAEEARKQAALNRKQDIDYQNANAQSNWLDQYLNRLGFFNGAGGTTHTEGTNVVPPQAYGGPSPAAAGIAAGAGTFFAGYGAGYGRPAAPAGNVPAGGLLNASYYNGGAIGQTGG